MGKTLPPSIALDPEKNFFSIQETSRVTEVKPHVLRYWESEFKLLRPSRKVSGHRKYNRKDVQLIIKIKNLLHEKGLTIAGAKKFLNQEIKNGPEQLTIELQETGPAVETLKSAKQTVTEILEILR